MAQNGAGMPGIRPYRPGDEPELAAVCLKTAAAGSDATGLLEDDDLWATLFVLPYVSYAPELAFVVETDDGRVAGYLVAAADTDGFEAWFRGEWWPRFRGRWPEPGPEPEPAGGLDFDFGGGAGAQAALLRYAYGRGGVGSVYAAEYPAHLHIDLLPELQRQGWGGRLMDSVTGRLREAGVGGLHVMALEDNAAALRFYERLGFSELGREPGVVALGLKL